MLCLLHRLVLRRYTLSMLSALMLCRRWAVVRAWVAPGTEMAAPVEVALAADSLIHLRAHIRAVLR